MSRAYQMYINERLIEMDYRDEPKLTNVSTDWGGRLSPAVGFAGYPVGYVPHMFGGGRMRDTIVPGAQAAGYPSVAMLAAEPQTGASYPQMDLTLESALPSQIMSGNGKMKKMRVKKVKEVVQAVKDAVKDEMEPMEGGKISRVKKATKWTKYAADTASKGIDLVKKAAPVAAMFGFGEEEAAKAAAMAAEATAAAAAAAAPRKRAPSARAAVVKAIMAKHGLGMIEASKYVKANNIPY
jgi:hypothetical protein